MRKKIMRIQTDSTPLGEPLDPDTDTVFALHRLFGGPELDELREAYAGGNIGYGESKKRLVPKILGALAPLRDRYDALHRDPDYVDDVLADGARRARRVADEVLARCREAAGFSPRPLSEPVGERAGELAAEGI